MTALQPLIQSRTLALREQRVMLDADLARLHGAQTRVLVQAVKRSRSRFPEQGVAMLSSVLGRQRAVAANIEIMRTFVRVRAPAMRHDTFSRNTRNQLKQVFDALRELLRPPDPPKRPIGFITPEDKGKKAPGKRA